MPVTDDLKFFPLLGIHKDGSCKCNKPDCTVAGKHPAVAWKTDLPCTKGEDGGIGIPTGSVNGIVVVEGDVKPELGIDGVSLLLSLGPMPPTLSVESPSGSVHFYFKAPAAGIGNSASAPELGAGIDVRGEGGMVVGPGSPHKKGGVYKILEDFPVAELPAWLLERLVAIEKNRPSKRPRVAAPVGRASGAKPRATSADVAADIVPSGLPDKTGEELERAIATAKDYLAKEDPCVMDGTSSSRWMRVITRVRLLRIPIATSLKLVNDIFNARCVPPWSEEELLRALGNVERGAAVADRVQEMKIQEGFFDRLSGRISPPQGPGPALPGPAPAEGPEREYVYAPGDRRNGETSAYDFGQIQADLFSHKHWYDVLSFDSFRCRVVAINPPLKLDAETRNGLSDDDVENVRGYFEFLGHKTRSYDIRAALMLVSKRRSFNPLQDYLRGLVWDGVPRLDRVCPDYFNSPNGEYEKAVGPRWFISLVARALEPGCQSDCTLILEGLQGKGKTSAFRSLMHDPLWYAESSSGVDTKDFLENLRGIWLFGFDELDSLQKSSLTKVKTTLTALNDHYRKSYGHFAQDFLRSCGFGGTTNGTQYLNDQTGGRRFWPIKVLRDIDIAKLVRDRDQLWAEAVVRFLAGEAWHVNTPELRALCEVEQEERLQIDAWEPIIVDWLHNPLKVSMVALPEEEEKPAGAFGGLSAPKIYDASRGVKTSDVLELALEKPKGQITNFDAQRVASVLKRIGWSKIVQEKKTGHRRYRKE